MLGIQIRIGFKETGRVTVVTVGLADTVRALDHVVAGAMAKGRGQLKGAKNRHQQGQCTKTGPAHCPQF